MGPKNLLTNSRCVQMEDVEKATQALHLTCLLIPPASLATLCYLLQVPMNCYLKFKLYFILLSVQFFEAVASNSSKNLMDASNISIVMAPTLMPIHIAATSRNERQNCTKLQNSAKVIQVRRLFPPFQSYWHRIS